MTIDIRAPRSAVRSRSSRSALLYLRAEAVREPELCDECQSPMILGRSGYGWWFRCVKPGCGGKRDLSGEPGRAVELLTEVR